MIYFQNEGKRRFQKLTGGGLFHFVYGRAFSFLTAFYV